jgi:predicted DNA-binding protein (UPF0251 family)
MKYRKVCHLPPATAFTAEGGPASECTCLSLDEYECIRLLDYMGFSQEECAAHMQISRATAQLIYESARKKLASALVLGQGIRIQGGHFRLATCEDKRCECHKTV